MGCVKATGNGTALTGPASGQGTFLKVGPLASGSPMTKKASRIKQPTKRKRMTKKNELSETTVLAILEKRFEANMHRHRQVRWQDVVKRIKLHSKTISVLINMEQTDGEPDVVGFDQKTGAITFMDCAQQSPISRRSVCYDQAAWVQRKEAKPKNGNALSLANEMGVILLNESQYLFLQSLEDIDTKSSSWLLTPNEIREKGGAIFGDKRFGRAFIFHNGADSYYAERGFRTVLMI